MTTTSGSTVSIIAIASCPLPDDPATSKPSRASIDVSMLRTRRVSSTTITRIGGGIGARVPAGSDGRSHAVTGEATSATGCQHERDEPHQRACTDGKGQGDEQQARALADGEEDQGKDHRTTELVRLLGALGPGGDAHHHTEAERGDRGGDP